MHLPENYFTSFNGAIDEFSLPERFTFPFYYQPHPLCLLAANELQQYLASHPELFIDFNKVGKMFGVLLVKNKRNEIGYLSAFSGSTSNQHLLNNFVPPVVDILAKDSFFLKEQREINQINSKISDLENNPKLDKYFSELSNEKIRAEQHVQTLRDTIIINRKDRKQQRAQCQHLANESELSLLNEKLSKESIQEKNQLKTLKLYWDEKIAQANEQYCQLTKQITTLKNTRKSMSATLQKKLFNQYQMLNIAGETKNLNELFKETAFQTPPAGSGDCAAPKLLQYAFMHGMKPLAMAEFWWGNAPKSEIRQHKNFYPACQSKCQPILGHMLDGIETDDNPMLVNPTQEIKVTIIYQDDAMLVINKPAEFLSVPGKTIEDSVYARLKKLFPKATGPLIVHRLDMSTSGLMLIALTKRANKSLQKQFINRTITKRYVALIQGTLKKDEGIINLPLRGDINDRPRQMVCFEHGKPAETTWQVIARSKGQTKVYLYPKTGRTHQLRVHCAHPQGLHMPIIGDDLYGYKKNRLHLHAESITFNHPITKVPMHFQLDPAF